MNDAKARRRAWEALKQAAVGMHRPEVLLLRVGPLEPLARRTKLRRKNHNARLAGSMVEAGGRLWRVERGKRGARLTEVGHG